MPELPEVETVRRNIESGLVGLELAAAEVRLPKLLRDSPISSLDPLAGRVLTRAGRRAKVLILEFEGDLSLLVHMKLAGQWAIVPPDGSRLVAGHPVPEPFGPLPHKATHVTFTFRNGTVAYYSDVRQFGWLRLMPSEDVEAAIAAFGFGPEGTGNLDIKALSAAMTRRSIPVKTLLLDQTFVAGLGNIYVDEVLHLAKVHPSKPANALSAPRRRVIIEAIPGVLARGIEIGGAKIVRSRAYPIDQFPAVHGRENEPCFRCGTTIIKTRVGGRGTYLCPKCQPAPRPRAQADSSLQAVE